MKTNEILTTEMQQIKAMIIDTVTQRDAFKTEMELWYQEHPKLHYPNMKNLILIDATLSKLDSFYKKLWDYHNAK
ncbi:hypothetical protein [Sulfurimonas sp. HSL3-2]|uniref:hypothetical protein n=1 Tax=Hydrocurvibacter mobilis TaxID=3131936 RepID=UPI0031F8B992